ncbi:GTPase-activating protein [Maudiozyma humilis]|uniref:GTPase-activating protein n=1 Tax=Maudiozyma humilis TaxID=51915 RepID=A0AAV5S4I0_MAUHU|nr:GTPase-activating protein [Kazachstania humilis]
MAFQATSRNKVNAPNETFVCTKCDQKIDSGNFYTINNFHYHDHCFHCFKCQKFLASKDDKGHNDKLLVLENGTLICSNCSDSCRMCGKKIFDLAIILSNNEAYCPDCFRCTKCNTKITDLKYAKTKNGIFCINCHQVLLQKRRLLKENLLKGKNSSHSIEVPQRSPSRNINRDKPIYGTNPNSLPMLLNKNSTSSSLLSSSHSNPAPNERSSNSQSSTDSKTHLLNNQQQNLRMPPTLLKDSTLSSIRNVESTDDDGSKTSREHLEVEPKTMHGRNQSIDDMLNATLDQEADFVDGNDSPQERDEINNINTDDEHEDSPDSVEHDATDRSFLHATPVKHTMESAFSENSLIADYDNESIPQVEGKIIPQELPELPTSIMPDIDNRDTSVLNSPDMRKTSTPSMGHAKSPINSPKAVQKSDSTHNVHGLALDLPMFSFEDKETYQKQKFASGTSNPPGKPNANIPINNTNTPAAKSATTTNTPYVTKLDQPTSAPPTIQKNKKLNRSFSLKDKFFNGFKSKSPKANISSPHPLPTNIPIGNSADTHSGWGVSPKNNSRTTSNDKPVNVFKGSSDTLLYNKYNHQNGPIGISSPIKNIQTPQRHNRSQSTASQSSQTTATPKLQEASAHVAMFRTPPLDNNALFKRGHANSGGDHARSKSYDTSSKVEHPVSVPATSSATPIVVESIDGADDSVITRTTDSSIPSEQKISEHHRSVSWQTALHLGHKIIDEVDETRERIDGHGALGNFLPGDNNSPAAKTEALDYEMKVRKMKLDLKNLENTKVQLLLEIERLRQTKDTLSTEVNQLRLERDPVRDRQLSADRGTPSSYGRHSRNNSSVVNDGNLSNISTPITHMTQSPQSNSKQKFWKIFGKDSNSNAPRGKGSQLNFGTGNGDPDSSVNTFSSSKFGVPQGNNVSPNHSGTSGLQSIVLTDLCEFEDTNVPNVVTKCVDYIESDEELLRVQGLYRKSGSQSQIEAVEQELYGSNSANFQFGPDVDINVVTNVLKRFLRNLQIPVLPFALYDPLIAIVKENNLLQTVSLTEPDGNDAEVVKRINARLQSMLFQQLPREHLNLLQVIIAHVNKVAAWKDENLMTLHNLSLVFAPSLFHDVDFERDIADLKERNYLVEYLFTYKIIV